VICVELRTENWELGIENRKGRDIGYALAASFCEEANSVEACTVTAPDAITAFAVPNPNCPSQSRRFFQVWLPFRSPVQAYRPAYFGLANLNSPTLSAIDERETKVCAPHCQCPFLVQLWKSAPDLPCACALSFAVQNLRRAFFRRLGTAPAGRNFETLKEGFSLAVR
jgi:hypothetical protein